MSNPVENAIEKVGSVFSDAVKAVVGLEQKAANFFSEIEKIDPAVKTELTQFVADTEAFIAETATAAGESGVNFSADSAAYTAFLKVRQDVITLAGTLIKAKSLL